MIRIGSEVRVSRGLYAIGGWVSGMLDGKERL